MGVLVGCYIPLWMMSTTFAGKNDNIFPTFLERGHKNQARIIKQLVHGAKKQVTGCSWCNTVEMKINTRFCEVSLDI